MYVAILLLQCLVFAVIFAFIVLRREFNIYHPVVIYSAFHAIVFVIRPVLAHVYGYDHGLYKVYEFSPDQWVKVKVILITLVGYVSFCFFALHYGPSGIAFPDRRQLEWERDALRPAFLVTALLLGPVALWSIAVSFSGTVERTLDMATGRVINVTSNGYATDAQLMAVSICAILGWVMRFRLLAVVPTVGFLLVRAGLGSRGALVATLATLTLLYAHDKRIRVPSGTIIGVVLAGALIFRIVGDDRGLVLRAFQDNQIALEEVGAKSENHPLESMDYANSFFLEYVVNVVPERSGTYNYFADVLEVFTAPVPRKWWPGKPPGSPVVLVNLFDYGFPIGMTFSLPGEGWFSLGWAGVVLWCGAWGALLGIWYERFATGRGGVLKTLAYLTFYPVLVVGFRDGMLLSMLKQSVWFLLPVGVWAYVARNVLRVPTYQEYLAIRRGQSRELIEIEEQLRAEPARPAAGARRVDLPPAVVRRRAALAALSNADAAERK